MKKILFLLFVSAFGICSCKDNDSIRVQRDALYWRANVDGDSINLTEGQNNYSCVDLIDSSRTLDGLYARPWTNIINASHMSTQDFVSLSFESQTFADFPTYAEFKAYFIPGPYTYATTPGTLQQNGVRIEYYERATNTMWYSYLGTQNGSTFTITDVTYARQQKNYMATVTANFSCTLYDPNGNSKPVTNGACIMTFMCYRE